MLKQSTKLDPTGLAKQIWQDVWSVSGATPENCLYTLYRGQEIRAKN